MLDAKKIAKESYWTLKITFGVVPIVAGIDKFTELLVDWTTYLSPWAAAVLPFRPEVFMMIVGVIEIAAGVLVLSKFTRIGALVVSAWLVGIALNLITAGYFDIAVRDLVMAVAAWRLARVALVVEEPREERSATARRETAHA